MLIPFASITLSLLIATSTSAQDLSPGETLLIAATTIRASIIGCDKNLWTEADESMVVDKAAKYYETSSSEIEKVVVGSASKFLSNVGSNKEKFCSMMVEEKIKHIDPNGGSSL